MLSPELQTQETSWHKTGIPQTAVSVIGISPSERTAAVPNYYVILTRLCMHESVYLYSIYVLKGFESSS